MALDPRYWQQEDPDRIVVWRPVSPPLAVEGPLELACFEGSILFLELASEQLALRTDDGRLQQVFLGDVHRLEIGNGARDVPCSSSVVFLRPDVPLDLRWNSDSCLVLNPDRRAGSGADQPFADTAGQGLRLPLRGACRLCLSDPMLFYETFLQGLAHPAQEHLLGVLDTLVRAQLATHLNPLLCGGDVDRLHAQILLSNLTPADLDEDLAEFGLGCLHLAACLPRVIDEQIATVPAGTQVPGSYDDLI